MSPAIIAGANTKPKAPSQVFAKIQENHSRLATRRLDKNGQKSEEERLILQQAEVPISVEDRLRLRVLSVVMFIEDHGKELLSSETEVELDLAEKLRNFSPQEIPIVLNLLLAEISFPSAQMSHFREADRLELAPAERLELIVKSGVILLAQNDPLFTKQEIDLAEQRVTRKFARISRVMGFLVWVGYMMLPGNTFPHDGFGGLSLALCVGLAFCKTSEFVLGALNDSMCKQKEVEARENRLNELFDQLSEVLVRPVSQAIRIAVASGDIGAIQGVLCQENLTQALASDLEQSPQVPPQRVRLDITEDPAEIAADAREGLDADFDESDLGAFGFKNGLHSRK